jgi:ribosomal protein S27E
MMMVIVFGAAGLSTRETEMPKRKHIEFKCPRCGGKAMAYTRAIAGCEMCGSLLYTEIPQDVKSRLNQNMGMINAVFLDRFDSVSDLRGKDRNYKNIKAAVLAAGRFSVFDVQTKRDGQIFTQLCNDPEIETFDMGYPWTGVRRKREIETVEHLLEAIEDICQENNETSEFGLPTHDKKKMSRIALLIKNYTH